jgi:hypothetical protein
VPADVFPLQKRRVEPFWISGSFKNGILSAFGVPAEVQTAFLGCLEFQMDQERRLESFRRGGRAENGVSGKPEIAGGLKTAFFGHLEFPVERKRRL